MDGIAFESKSEKKARRKEKQEARERVLDKAKRDYAKDQWRKEQAKLRGEDTWMLPVLNDRLEQEQKDYEKKAKKAKKEKKKKKKHKKEKKRKNKEESDSSSEDSDDEAVWVEKGTTIKSGSYQLPVDEDKPVMKGPQLQRDSWMESPLDIIPTISKKEILEQKKLEEEKRKAEDKSNLLDKAGQHERELNPYWKDGGTGLPENKPKSSLMGSVGDGGLSWMKRAYQRCVEQAKEEGRSLELVATEKYGSLKKLEKMLSDAEKANEKMQKDQGNERRGRFRRPGDDDDEGSSKNRYFSSRRERSRSRERYRKKSRSRSRERYKRSRSPNERRFKKPLRSHSRSPERKNDYRSRSPYDKNSSKQRRRSRSPKYGRRSRSRSPKYRDKQEYGRSSFSSRFKRPGSDGESTPPRDKPKGRFAKPGDFDDEDSQERKDGHYSSRKPDIPAWKKKQYANVEKKTEEKIPERKKREVSPSSSSSSESESESSESDEPELETAPPIKVLTEQEMNQLGAKIVKAEIMGDTDTAAKLKAELDQAREIKERNKTEQPVAEKRREEGDDVVLLTRTDKHGRVRPLPEMLTDGKGESGKRRKTKQKVDTHGKQGERKQYFDDDDNFDLKTLVEREKMGTAEDDSLMFARLAGRSMGKTSDDYQIDDVFLDRAAKKQSISISEMKERSQAIADHRKMAGKLEKCQFCFGNVPKHLIIAIGTKSYLCLPNHKSLAEGHCLIVPMHHTASGTALDEDVWEEIQVFRKSLVKMFLEDDEDIVFMETSMRLNTYPHMALECVPLPRELGDMAPIYFKKAIQESEYEWSDNKKLVDLKGRDVRRAIPKGFPYFSVDFGNEGGFAHVIEDESTFPYYFGREIVGGMLDAEPTLWRKPTRENFDDQRKKVLQFAEKWKSYDWTQKLCKNDDD